MQEKIKNYLQTEDPKRIIITDIISSIWGKTYLNFIPPEEAHKMKIDIAMYLKSLGYEMKLIKTWNKK